MSVAMTSELYQPGSGILALFCMACVLVDCSYLSVGDDLKMVCTLDQHQLKAYSAHDISFSVRHQHQRSAEENCLPKSSVAALNRTTAMLTLPSVTLQDTGKYDCHVGSSKCQTSEQTAKLDAFVLSEDFFVEEVPQKVTNLVCVVFNWDESLTCHWQHPVNYSNKGTINVTCFYTVRHSSLMYPCPKESYNGCTWSRGEFMSTVYVLQVSVTNTRTARKAPALFVIDTVNLVKPAPVQQLTAIEDPKGSGCFNVLWTHSRKSSPKIYRIQHQIVGQTQTSVLSAATNETKLTSCGYSPYTHHRFSVSCFPTSIWSGNWSDPVFTDAWTSMTAPGLGPRVTNGSFTSTECVAGARTVTVMWQEVEKHQQHGVIDGYIIRLGDTTLANVSAHNFWADIRLPCTSTSHIHIYAHNEAGHSQQPSAMLIPPVTFKVPSRIQDSFAVKITGNQTVNQTESLVAVWNVNPISENITCTVFWCMSQSLTTCQGEINWVVVPGHQRQLAIPIPAELGQKYHFGISVSSLQIGLASGIHWTQCLFAENPFHVPAVNNLRVQGQDGTVWLSWDPQPCTYQSKVKVTGYIIKWCLQSNRHDVHEAWVPASESFYTLSDLAEKEVYLFTVQSVSDGTVGDEVTPWRPASIPASEFPIWLLILIGLVGVLISSCMCAVWRACKKRGKQFKAIRDKQITDLLNGLSRSPAPDRVVNNRLLQRSSEDSLTPPTSMEVHNTSEDSLTLRTSVALTPTEGQSRDSESGDSLQSDNSNNSRTFLIMEPAHGHRNMKAREPSTGPAVVCAPVSTTSNIPQFESTAQIQPSTTQVEPNQAQPRTDGECSTGEQAELYLHLVEC